MAKKLFVGNINWNASKEDLENIFSQYGELEEVILIKDENGRSKGFGFVEMATPEGGSAAIDMYHGKMLDGRTLTVNEARPLEPRARGGFGK